ncbi:MULTISPECIES: hypothetical protein [unclassified Xanthobacter]|uniref:hypothetical protein n=1 Tax=unclassified Xanthobacter TaxID=2623496 RepID=UPI001F22FA28|nr:MULTISPECIES: hypothetical protein [unclassified Xanthobacter]
MNWVLMFIMITYGNDVEYSSTTFRDEAACMEAGRAMEVLTQETVVRSVYKFKWLCKPTTSK